MSNNMQDEIRTDHILLDPHNPYTDAVGPLVESLLKNYKPSLTQVEKTLNELKDKESLLFDQVHNENLALAGTLYSDELNAMFNKIESYQNKLVNIKKEMKNLHEKSIKLKRRSLRVQQLREKQEYIKQQKEVELKAEQELVAKSTNT